MKNYSSEFPIGKIAKEISIEEILQNNEVETRHVLCELNLKAEKARNALANGNKDIADILLIEIVNTTKFLTR